MTQLKLGDKVRHINFPTYGVGQIESKRGFGNHGDSWVYWPDRQSHMWHGDAFLVLAEESSPLRTETRNNILLKIQQAKTRIGAHESTIKDLHKKIDEDHRLINEANELLEALK